MRKYLSLLVVITLMGLGLHYAVTHTEELRDIKNLSLGPGVGLLLATLLYLHAQGLILKTVVEPWGIHLKFREWFGVVVVALLGNYIFPFAGLGFRAAYLKKAHGFSYASFMTTSVAIVVTELLVFALGGLAGASYCYWVRGSSNLALLLLFAGIVFGVGLVMLFSPTLAESHQGLVGKVALLLRQWKEVRTNRALVHRVMGLTAYLFIVNALMFQFAFLGLGISASPATSGLVTALSDFSLFFRIAPGALGTYDAAVLYSLRAHQFTIGQGIWVAFLVRAGVLAWLFTLGPVFSYLLMRGDQKVECPSPSYQAS